MIVTPGKNYTVLQQKQLLKDMGDTGGVSNGTTSSHGIMPGLGLSLHA